LELPLAPGGAHFLTAVSRRSRAGLGLALLAIAVAHGRALAQTEPGATTPTTPASATASPSPAVPAATPRPLGLRETTTASLTFIGQGTAGPGQVGPEAAGFIAGRPLAPNTPYDLLTSAPLVSGNSGIGELLTTFSEATRGFDVHVTAGLASVRGSVTNAVYWGENLMPTLNPHLGSQALPYAVAFPSHPGQDDGTATRLSVLSGSAATPDGNLALRGGWFDLTQTDRFVFTQPAMTSENPAIAYAPAESLTSGVPQLDDWAPVATALPLQGVDLTAKRGTATLELSNAALPALPGESARLSLGSIVFDRGEGTRFSAELLHATTSGLTFLTTIPFGAQPTFFQTPQGLLPASLLNGQRQTIAGVRAAFHAVPALGIDGVVEIGRSWFASTLAARPGTDAPGGFYHAGLIETRGRATASLDFFRMEPRYAPMILPYGVPENQWSVAFAWPGQWLKSNYQLIDNSVLGVNRQGYRLRYFIDHGPFELHLEYTELRQIDAETFASAQQTGFIDGYYLPQPASAATFGRQQRSALWATWHPTFGDFTLDIVDDALYRPFIASRPEDAVSYEVPQAVLSYSRRFSPALLAATGYGRYALKGTFSEPIDFAERLFFAGIEVRQTPRASLLVTFRRTAFGGITTYPLVPNSPDFTGSMIVAEQRLRM
jgi:hypothetical protein